MLTPRAEALVVPLRTSLVTLGRAFSEPSEFEPSTAQRAFRLASPDLFDVLAIPPLLEQIRQRASGVDIAIVPLGGRTLDAQLETGEVDIAIVPRMDEKQGSRSESASGLVRRTLFRDKFSCLLRADHPSLVTQRRRSRARKAPTLSLETYLSLSHALVSPSGAGPGLVDEILRRKGLTRRIALRIPHFYSALAIIAKSDLIITAPSALAELAHPALGVISLPPPLPLPEHSINLVWHERFSKDPGHTWLRDLVAEVTRTRRIH